MAVTNYLWDMESDNVLMESDEAGVTTAVYTHEPEQYGKLISQHRDGETSFYHFDGQGATRALTNPSQNVTDTYVYDAWGDEVDRTGATENPFQWIGGVGYYRDPETATYYIRARAYAPTIARWLSRDPIGFKGGSSNLYEYAALSPNRFVDPSGTDKQHVKDCLEDAHDAFERCCARKLSDFDCAGRCNRLPFWAVGLCWVVCKALRSLASTDCAAGIGLMGIICQFEIFRKR